MPRSTRPRPASPNLPLPFALPPSPVSIGSLFAGIGGLEWGLEEAVRAAGGHAGTAWQVELNPYAREVLASHWPGAPQFEDVRAVSGRELGPVRWLVGGSPCTDVSKAAYRWGRLGFGGERSGLWREQLRLIGELAPDLVVWENVGGALCTVRHQGEIVGPPPLAVVLRDLHRRGYDAFWTTLLASSVGAQHLRLRVFVVGVSRSAPRRPTPPGVACRTALDLEGRLWPSGPFELPREGEPVRQILRSTDVPYHLERIEAGGNAVVPECAFAVGGAALALDAWMRQGHSPSLRPGRDEPHSPRAQFRRLAALARACAEGAAPLEFLTHLDAMAPDAPPAGAFARTWPSVGWCREGRASVHRLAPVLPGPMVCSVREACDGADPVEASDAGLWPTATSRDWRSGRSSEATRGRNARPLSEVAAPGGFLNPAWVDVHMGFPEDWTRLEGTRLTPRRRGTPPKTRRGP